MKRVFWIIVALTIATFILAIAMAYVQGVEEGKNSLLDYITELQNQLEPNLWHDNFTYLHPSKPALFEIGISLALCWIGVAAFALVDRKPQV
jgi:hypothetical protein